MRAIRIREPGGPEVLELVELPEPEPGPGEALVRVRAAGVNRADLLQRAGRYPAPPGSPADIPGLEFAGEVVRHGPARPGLAPWESSEAGDTPSSSRSPWST
jgi:NADPH:quinone reductase-like Zn-dependent oxidoreductase